MLLEACRTSAGGNLPACNCSTRSRSPAALSAAASLRYSCLAQEEVDFMCKALRQGNAQLLHLNPPVSRPLTNQLHHLGSPPKSNPT